MSKQRGDRGAAAVEFAIVLPMLLLLICGIIDFGRVLNAQVTVTAAAREGARWAALGKSGVEARVQSAAPGLNPAPTTTVQRSCPATAAPGDTAQVRVSLTMTPVTPLASLSALFGGAVPASIPVSATGVMRCGA